MREPKDIECRYEACFPIHILPPIDPPPLRADRQLSRQAPEGLLLLHGRARDIATAHMLSSPSYAGVVGEEFCLLCSFLSSLVLFVSTRHGFNYRLSLFLSFRVRQSEL